MQYPEWIIDEVRRNKISLRGACATGTAGDLHTKAMHTVCDEAKCPNKGKCFSEGEATFMILGDICTRKCAFCAVTKNRPPLPPDPDEPRHAAELCRKWNLKYVVYTSPTRDDLPDGGAWQFAETTRLIKQYCPGIKTEPLIPDFAGKETALKIVLASGLGPVVVSAAHTSRAERVCARPNRVGTTTVGSARCRMRSPRTGRQKFQRPSRFRHGRRGALGVSDKEIPRWTTTIPNCSACSFGTFPSF